MEPGHLIVRFRMSPSWLLVLPAFLFGSAPSAATQRTPLPSRHPDFLPCAGKPRAVEDGARFDDRGLRLAHSVALRYSGYRKSLLVDKFFGGSTPDKIELSLPSSCEASKAIAGAPCEA